MAGSSWSSRSRSAHCSCRQSARFPPHGAVGAGPRWPVLRPGWCGSAASGRREEDIAPVGPEPEGRAQPEATTFAAMLSASRLVRSSSVVPDHEAAQGDRSPTPLSRKNSAYSRPYAGACPAPEGPDPVAGVGHGRGDHRRDRLRDQRLLGHVEDHVEQSHVDQEGDAADHAELDQLTGQVAQAVVTRGRRPTVAATRAYVRDNDATGGGGMAPYGQRRDSGPHGRRPGDTPAVRRRRSTRHPSITRDREHQERTATQLSTSSRRCARPSRSSPTTWSRPTSATSTSGRSSPTTSCARWARWGCSGCRSPRSTAAWAATTSRSASPWRSWPGSTPRWRSRSRRRCRWAPCPSTGSAPRSRSARGCRRCAPGRRSARSG